MGNQRDPRSSHSSEAARGGQENIPGTNAFALDARGAGGSGPGANAGGVQRATQGTVAATGSLRRGEPADDGNGVVLTDRQTVVGMLSEDYFPRYYNGEQVTGDKTCLSGFGFSAQTTRFTDVARLPGTTNKLNQILKAKPKDAKNPQPMLTKSDVISALNANTSSLAVPAASEPRVLSGSAMYGFIQK